MGDATEEGRAVSASTGPPGAGGPTCLSSSSRVTITREMPLNLIIILL